MLALLFLKMSPFCTTILTTGVELLVVRANMAKHTKKRIPKLSYTANRGIGFYVSYRDATTGNPRKHRFGNIPEKEAKAAYNEWLGKHLTGEARSSKKHLRVASSTTKTVAVDIVQGSLLHVVSGLLAFDESRLRKDGVPKSKGTIGQKQFSSRRDLSRNFLEYLNQRHGSGAVGRMKLADLSMEDVEDYNRNLAQNDYSNSQVTKSINVVKAIIDRAGRPEYGRQLLSWNWDSRDVYHGRPDKPVTLPTVKQLKLILAKCDARRTCMVWMAIGLGFGQGDLSAARAEHFDNESYDMRRGKTGIQRYGDMPKIVWNSLQSYLSKHPRSKDELLFLTDQGMPLVHGTTDSVVQWWDELRKSLKDDGKGLNGFYSFRHLGATEYGSRPGCSIAAMRGWLGHSASSVIADRYMKPVAPENKAVVAWVRKAIESGRVSLKLQ
jgi:integrase